MLRREIGIKNLYLSEIIRILKLPLDYTVGTEAILKNKVIDKLKH